MNVTNIQLVRVLHANRVPLMTYIRTILPDFHLAEDVYQEVSVQAVLHLEKIRDEDHLKQWLYLTAKHRAINFSKRKDHQQSILFDEDMLDRYEACLMDIDSHTDVGVKYKALQDCLSRLTPYAKRLVYLRYCEGLTGQALGDTFGRKANTVYVALTRVHGALRTCLKKQINFIKGDTAHG